MSPRAGGFIRRVLGVIVGLIAFVATIWICEFAGSRVAPPPPGMDPRSPDMLKLLSPVALVLVLLGWAVASLVAGFVSVKISQRRWSASAVAVFGTIVGVSNNLQFPPPPWFWIFTFVAFLPPALLGARLAQRGPAG